jgi:hypothetical protein
MSEFSIASLTPLDHRNTDTVVVTPTGSTHNSFGTFAASGEGVRILVNSAVCKNPGEAYDAISNLRDHLLDRASKIYPPAATP